jgi:hypothetical protein
VWEAGVPLFFGKRKLRLNIPTGAVLITAPCVPPRRLPGSFSLTPRSQGAWLPRPAEPEGAEERGPCAGARGGRVASGPAAPVISHITQAAPSLQGQNFRHAIRIWAPWQIFHKCTGTLFCCAWGSSPPGNREREERGEALQEPRRELPVSVKLTMN